MTQTAWIVLGDVVESRKITDREGFEAKVDQTISKINDEFANDIVAEFTRLKGIDEIGGILNSVRSLVTIQRILSLGLHPDEIRIAVVRGEVAVGSGDDMSEMDGPGFAKAADELEKIESTGTTFSIKGLSQKTDNLITAGINMIDVIRNNWTERRVEVLELYREHGSQQDVATMLGVTRQTINSHINDASVERVEHAESTISEEIDSLSFGSIEDFN